MITHFNDVETEKIFHGIRSKKFPQAIQQTAQRKLLMLDASLKVQDLRVPPGNRLESLKGNRKNVFSIRINDQWRVCFRFEDGVATQVEIIDYHS